MATKNDNNTMATGSDEEPSWQAKTNMQVLVGKNIGEEGFTYNQARNMKQRTGIVKEAMSSIDQKAELVDKLVMCYHNVYGTVSSATDVQSRMHVP